MLRTATFTILCVTLASSASAQDAAADIEGGDTEYSTQTKLRTPRARRGGGGSDMRVAIQGRLPLAALAWSDGDLDGGNFGGGGGGGGGGGANFDGLNLTIPMVTPGLRLIDGKLFVGLGLGFSSWSWDQGANEASRTAWSLSPVFSYDVLSDEAAALSLGGAIHLMKLGETEDCDPDCNDVNDDAFGLGLNLTAGIRGHITEGLSIGGDFGYSFLNVEWDSGPDVFWHGLVGALVVEGSVGI